MSGRREMRRERGFMGRGEDAHSFFFMSLNQVGGGW